MTKQEMIDQGMALDIELPAEDIGVGEGVDNDDWDLGPACGLEPGVCEACE